MSLERYICLQLGMDVPTRAGHAYSLYVNHVSGSCLDFSPLGELIVVS